MNRKERFLSAIEFKETDRPPHFEQKFELFEQALGKKMPSYEEFKNCITAGEKERFFCDCADLYQKMIEKYKWDALLVLEPFEKKPELFEFIKFLKKYIGNDIPIGTFLFESVISIDIIKDYMEFSVNIIEEPEKIHTWAAELKRIALEYAEKIVESGCDIVDMASDSGFNAGPFLSPAQFKEFVVPYGKEIIDYFKSHGIKVIFHSDGYLMPILNDIMEMGPHILQSIDPMAGMDIAEVKKLTYGKLVLMGNVQCSLLQDGPDDEIIKSAKYCLDYGPKGGGFIYSSSNTIFDGLPLKNYELMLNYFWKRYQV
jgi:uroporphyrinogen decarboxylase